MPARPRPIRATAGAPRAPEPTGAPVTPFLAFLGFLGETLALAAEALGFGHAAFEYVADEPWGWSLAIVIVFFAGVSQTFGESLVLFLNRVRPWRFVLSLLLTGVVYVAYVVATAWTLRLGTMLVPGVSVRLDPVIGILALANAPHLFGVLVLMPYLGGAIARLIEVWVLALTIFGLHVGLDIPVLLAGLSALSGWIVMRLLMALFGGPLSRLHAALRRRVSGSALDLDASTMVDSLVARARESIGGRDER